MKVAALTDEGVLQLVKQGQNEVARGSALNSVIVHGNEEYGIITVYRRMKSTAPPATERAMRGRGGR